jgi:DNA-binding NtrC family response regulator
MAQADGAVRSVMIVDDDIGYAASLADLLQLKGYDASCVVTPARARRCVHRPTTALAFRLY